MFKLVTLQNEKVKGLYYKEDLKAVPKLHTILKKIVDQRVKKGVKVLKFKCAKKLLLENF